jgi:hypothetical protein
MVPPTETTSSCARTDAKSLDRDVQMKYDVAKNEEGPLRRTIRVGATSQAVSNSEGKQRRTTITEGSLSRERHPGLDERLVNIEKHLAVRYGKPYSHSLSSQHVTNLGIVPSPPQSLLDRLKFLEDHIIRLEKDYPPWAALHFNQPLRGVSCISLSFADRFPH